MDLKPRLRTILRSVPKGTRVADIGTDHAFLPIALIKEGVARSVLACDISEGPLSVAKENIEKTKTQNIETRLCDGLEGISSNEADVITIAGMGGDVIKGILKKCAWIKDEEKLLILQPMSSADVLREYLYLEGFSLEKEEAVEDSGRVYSVITARYSGASYKPSLAEIFIGKLVKDRSVAADRYIELQYLRVKNCAESLKEVERKRDEYLLNSLAAQEIKAIIEKRK